MFMAEASFDRSMPDGRWAMPLGADDRSQCVPNQRDNIPSVTYVPPDRGCDNIS